MRVSVVVPVYNGASALETTVPSVLSLGGVEEWVWVDDGSTDDSADLLSRLIDCEPRARMVRLDQNCGRGAARNAGAEETVGEVIVFLDVDVAPPPNAASALIDALGSGVASVGRVHSVLSDPSDPYQLYLARGRRGPQETQAGRSVSWRHFLSGVCAVRRSAFDAAGRFDESVRYGEDFALACALAARHPNGLSLADVEVDVLNVAGLDVALQNVRQFGNALPRIASRFPGALDLAGLGRAVQLPGVRRVAQYLAPRWVRRAVRWLPAPLQVRAVRYLLGHALLVGVYGDRDRTP